MPVDDRRQKYASELDRAARILTRAHPVGRVIDRLEVADRLQQLFPDDDNVETTPEWLKNQMAGGLSLAEIDFHNVFQRMFAGDPAQPDGSVVPAFRTRGRVRRLMAVVREFLKEDDRVET